MKTALSIAAISVAALLVGCNNSSKTDAAPGAVGNAKACGVGCSAACCATKDQKASPGALSTDKKASGPACCPFSGAGASGCNKTN